MLTEIQQGSQGSNEKESTTSDCGLGEDGSERGYLRAAIT